MAVTQNSYTANGSTDTFSFTFQYLATTDIKVKLNGVDTTAYTLPTATTVKMNSMPSNGDKIIIYRNTDNDNKKATFYPGSAIKAEDLNNNLDQILYTVQEVDNNAMSTLGDTAMQGDMLIGEGFGLQFEGTTANDNETRLVAADPTADRTITLPNVTGTVVTTGDTGTVTDAMLDAGTALTSAERTKLTGIETGATGDQTNAEIRTAVEAASNSNVFTDADHSKLNAIEANATADQTAAEIRTLVESATNSNVFTDADHSKLNAIEASATADQTAAEIRTLVDSATDSNVFTDADHTKLDGIATSANNYTHPNHTGEVTSTADGATVIANNVVDEANLKISNAGSDGQYLQKQSGNTGGLTWATGPGTVGGDTGVDFNDSRKVRFGTDNDLELYHGGTNAQIINATGELKIRSDIIRLMNNAGNKNSISTGNSGGNVELYYNNSKKLETTDTGCLLIDDTKLELGGGSDLTLWHDGSNSYIQNITGNLIIKANTANDDGLKIIPDGAVELYYDNTKRFETTDAGASVNGIILLPSGAKIGSNENYIYQNGDGLVFKVGDGTSFKFAALRRHASGLDFGNLSGNTRITVGTNSELAVNCVSNGGVELNYDNSTIPKLKTTTDGAEINGDLLILDTVGNTLKLETHVDNGNDSALIFQKSRGGSGGQTVVQDDDDLGTIAWKGWDGSQYRNAAEIKVDVDNVPGAGDMPGRITFRTSSDGGSTLSTRLQLLSDGLVRIPSNTSKLTLGASDHLKMWHDGGNARITNSLGDFYIDSDVRIRKANGLEALGKFISDGAVELYYDGAKKFETTSEGIKVESTSWTTLNIVAAANDATLRLQNEAGGDHNWTIRNDFSESNDLDFRYNNSRRLNLDSSGNLTVVGNLDMGDNDKILLGNGDDLEIYHQGSHSFIKDSGTGNLKIAGSQTDIVNETNSEFCAKFIEDGAVQLFYDGSPKLVTTGSGITVTGSVSTNDINLSNLNAPTPNEVDGTRGSWTMQEGADDLFLINRSNGKKYKFNLTEVS